MTWIVGAYNHGGIMYGKTGGRTRDICGEIHKMDEGGLRIRAAGRGLPAAQTLLIMWGASPELPNKHQSLADRTSRLLKTQPIGSSHQSIPIECNAELA